MMKMYSRLLLLLLPCVLLLCRQKPNEPATLAQLPLMIKEGYGPFHLGFNILSNNRPDDPLWGKTYLPLIGMPKNWSSLSRSMVWLDSRQLVYQSFLTNRMTPEHYKYIQKEWRWTPDTTKLSAKPIKCYIHVITGFDEIHNKWAAMIDTNNNLDFSDETLFYPEVIKPGLIPDQYSDAHKVQYEVYQKGKISKAYLPLVVRMKGNHFIYNIPQYAVATLKRNNKTYDLLISSGFVRPTFEDAEIALTTSIPRSGRIDSKDIIALGGIIELDGVKYKNNRVDSFNNWLELEPVDESAKAYALQIGQPIYPFSGKDFITGKPVSLAQYKGKYVYVDFWETSCQPCIEEMPALKQIYQGLDKTRFDFVGIVNDSPERLSRFLQKHPLAWAQIRSDSINKLIEANHVSGYPTSVLVGPDGNVIARDLRSKELTKKLNELKLTP